MASLAKIILLLIALVFPLGQLARINLFGINLPLLDLLIVILATLNTLQHLKNHSSFTNRSFLYFLIFTWISYLFNLNFYPFNLKSLLYLLRLSSLLSFFVYPINHQLINPLVKQIFILSLFSSLIFGLIQYIFWPDLTYFSSLNWDPHLHRLVGAFLDPTFTGLIYLIFLIYLFVNKSPPIIQFIAYLSLALTYSRSSLLSFVLGSFFISRHRQQPKFFYLAFLISTITIFLLPRLPGEGTKLERTSSIQAKITNYQEAFRVWTKSPLIGHGYNNLVFVKHITHPQSHTNFGFDGSLATIATTTGIIGLILFLRGLINFYHQASFFQKTALIVTLFHSLFANSLLYPWIILLILFL